MGAHITCGIGLRPNMPNTRGRKRTQEEANQDEPIQAQPLEEDEDEVSHDQLLTELVRSKHTLNKGSSRMKKLQTQLKEESKTTKAEAERFVELSDEMNQDAVVTEVRADKFMNKQGFNSKAMDLADEVNTLYKKVSTDVKPVLDALKVFMKQRENETWNVMYQTVTQREEDISSYLEDVDTKAGSGSGAASVSPLVAEEVSNRANAAMTPLSTRLNACKAILNEARQITQKLEKSPRQTQDASVFSAIGWGVPEDQFKPPSKKQKVAIKAAAEASESSQ